MSDHDDSTLLHEYCDSHSETAFTLLVRRHLPMVYHAALRRLNSPALAEEAAQNAFARLAVKAAAVARHPERLRAWLHRTAFLEACTIARKETRLSRLPLPAVPSHEPMNCPEIYDRLDEALNALPELDRELLLRRCCGGEDFRRIAVAVGKSESACQKRVERALARLEQTLGGAGAASVVITALSAGSMKASAMPPAERVAAAALKKGAGSSAAGALSGLAVASCVAATLAGGTLGWQRERPVPSVPVAGRLPDKTTAPAPAKKSPPAATAPFTGSLDDVLESIQTGRLTPLIAFLPQATPADLRAILSEEDFSGLGEGSPPRSEAHQIALRHWANSDPPGAFAWSVARDRENTGHYMGAAAMSLAVWARADSAAALAAFAALPLRDRGAIVSSMAYTDRALTEQLVAAHPDLFWEAAASGFWAAKNSTEPAAAEKDEQIIAAALAGNHPGTPGNSVLDAFTRLAFKNPPDALARAAGIHSPKLRSQVESALRRRFIHRLPAAQLEEMKATLPPGLDRAHTVAALAGQLARTHPEEALRRLRAMEPGVERDVAFQQTATVLAGADPWALLETTAALRGPVSYAERAMRNDSGDGSYYDSGIQWEDALSRALAFASRDDPQRVLKLLPAIVTKLGRRGSEPYFKGVVEGVTMGVVQGLATQDLPAAIRWVAAMESSSLQNTFWISLHNFECPGNGSELIAMLDGASDAERSLLQRALGSAVEAAVLENTAPELLTRLPQRDADDILSTYADWASARNEIADAMRFAEHVSPARREENVWPEIAANWLADDAPAAVAWINTLPPAVRQAVLHRAAQARLPDTARAALQDITP